MTRVWLAGATGFLGSHALEALRRAGHEVVATSRSGDESRGIAPVDLCDGELVEQSAAGCEAAVLAAGAVSRDPDDAAALHRAHVVGTRTALAALRRAGVRRVVYVSTSGTIAVGRDQDRVFTEESNAPMEIIARWPYYRTKLYAEREALGANGEGFEVVVLNPTLLLGPGDERDSSTGDVRRFLNKEIPAIPAGGMSFVDVRDVARACVSALERGRPGERYLLSAKNLTIAAFFARLERISGVRAPVLRMPRQRAVAIGVNKLFTRAVKAIGGTPPVDEISVEMAQYYWYCNSSKAERELEFAPRDDGETLRDTVADLVERGVAFPKGARVAG